jgi:hypothetical protein
MRTNALMTRALICATTAVVATTGLGSSATSATAATSTMSSRYLLNHLRSASEHPDGYDRGKFPMWADVDHDGCDTRDEVLMAEARGEVSVHAGCDLRGGTWRSRYDGISTSDPSSFDIDHMVPLNEAWQSGAWRWSAGTRKAYANDLGYSASLIAVSAHQNRSKGDREPQAWMPQRRAYACTYVKRWVAVKWRWQLKVDATERSFLASELRACGWPSVATPSRPAITSGSRSRGGSGGGTGGGSTHAVGYAVHPGG